MITATDPAATDPALVLKTNVKGLPLQTRGLPLTHKILLVGPNGAGKSAVAQAIQLALTGAADDVAGRATVREPTLLAELIPPGEARVWSELTTPWGVASWELSRKGGATTKPVHTLPQNLGGLLVVSVPLLDLVAPKDGALVGRPERARAFLLRHACGEVDLARIRAVLPGELHALYDELTGGAKGVEGLLAASETVGARARAARAAAKATGASYKEQATALQTDAALGARPSADALKLAARAMEEADHEHRAAQGVLDRALGYETAVSGLQDQLARAGAELREALARLEALPPEAPPETPTLGVTPSRTTPVEAQATLRGALLVAEYAVITGACVGCGRTVSTQQAGAQGVEVRRALRSWAAEAAAAAADEVTTRRLPPGVEARRAAAVRVEGWAQRVLALRAQIDQLVPPGATPGRAVSVAASLSVADLAASQATARGLCQRLQAAEAAWSRLDVLLQDAHRQDALADRLGALQRALQRAVQILVESEVAAFCGRVQHYLPKGDVFWLDPASGRYGLQRRVESSGGVVSQRRDVALSGAEWARVTAALAMACAPTPDGVWDEGQSLPLVVLPDRAWDARTLASVCAAWQDWAGIVILTSTVKPHGTPKGWTMVECPMQGP